MNRVIHAIVERHADEAAFLWERRDRAARSPLFDLASLAEVDGRLDANLEGLVIARDHGLSASVAAFERVDRGTESSDGELFTAAFVAAELGDAMAFARLLVASERRPRGHRPIVSALGWLSPPRARHVLAELAADDCPPRLLRLALAGSAVRREDVRALLPRAFSSTDAALRARAFRAVGELGLRDFLPALESELHLQGDDADPWAVWSAALLGDSAAVRRSWRIAERGAAMSEVACALAARSGDVPDASARLAALAEADRCLPAALAGAEALGDPACIPWVLATIERRPDLARRAAWVYATITGARLEPPLAIRTGTPEPSDPQVARYLTDPHEDLPTPIADALRAHWDRVGLGFSSGERWLGGRRLDAAWAVECLRTGAQPWRASAAVELRRAAAGGALFPVRAPGPQQLMRLRRPA